MCLQILPKITACEFTIFLMGNFIRAWVILVEGRPWYRELQRRRETIWLVNEGLEARIR